MEINTEKLERVASEARAKAAGNARWINAINKAVDGLLGTWIVTELADCLLITTDNGTYHANGACQCKSYEFGKPCSHRAAAKLVKNMNEVADVATSTFETRETAPRVNTQPLATFDQMATAPIVKPQPRGTYCSGWSI